MSDKRENRGDSESDKKENRNASESENREKRDAPDEIKVRFYNYGRYEVVITSRDGRIKQVIQTRQPTPMRVRLGDVFDVEIKEKPKLVFQPIFINNSEVKDIHVYGNTPFNELGIWNPPLNIVDFESNLYGIDLTTFNPRLVMKSFSSKSIFEGLNPTSIDYVIQAGNILKGGMVFSATPSGIGSSDVRMAYGYSAFAKDWNLTLGVKGTAPVKGVDISAGLDFGYNQFERTERESTNIYAYTREQKPMYEIAIDPNQAYLSPDFIIAVNTVRSVKDAREKIIPFYGTHYATKVYYGGDRSAYVSMSRASYAKAKGFGIDIKATVAASTEQITGRKVTGKSETQKFGSSDLASGSLGFGFSERQEIKEVFENTRTGYQALGGEGGFDDWDVTQKNAVPVAVDLDFLYNLIEPQVFKDGTPPEKLKEKKRFIQEAIDDYLESLKTLDSPLPWPREYSITLDKLEVTDEIDDANKSTKGTVVAVVTPQPPGFSGILWSQSDYTEDFRYSKGNAIYPQTKSTFIQLPSKNGTFEPLEVSIAVDIYEKDDHAPFDHFAERHAATSTPVAISNLAEGDALPITCDAGAFTTLVEKGNIRATATVRRERSDFKLKRENHELKL